ncbi:Uncharacterized protein DAT39_005075, partial [Clarias magur]
MISFLLFDSAHFSRSSEKSYCLLSESQDTPYCTCLPPVSRERPVGRQISDLCRNSCEVLNWQCLGIQLEEDARLLIRITGLIKSMMVASLRMSEAATPPLWCYN